MKNSGVIFGKKECLATAYKTGVEYEVKQTKTHWKLISNGRIKVCFEWSKKDYFRFEDFISMLSQEGYIIALAD